jgi:hypothetical protein
MEFTPMPLHRLLVLFCLILVGCQSGKEDTKQPEQSGQAEQQWQASTLSPETIAKANAAVADYRQCLAKETAGKNAERGDPRAIANVILKACEDRLPAIKTAFDAESVPPVISERYIRKTRSQGVQTVLLEVSAVQAQKAGEEEEQAKKATKK